MSEADTPKVETQQEETAQIPLPPASFDYLVLSLAMDAQMHLGLIHFGKEEDRPKPNLPAAKHFIDLLGIIEDKTRGNLSLEEKRHLENSLTELRFRYVQATQEGQTK